MVEGLLQVCLSGDLTLIQFHPFGVDSDHAVRLADPDVSGKGDNHVVFWNRSHEVRRHIVLTPQKPDVWCGGLGAN